MLVQSSNDRSIAEPIAGSLELAAVGFETVDSQALMNGLRNIGLAVHPRFAEDQGALTKLLREAEHNIYLLNFDSTHLPHGYAVTAILNANPHASVVLVAADPTQALSSATSYGARDVVHATELDRLAFLLQREQADLTRRKESGQLADRLNDAEHRCRILINTSRDAIAYVHAGMHVHANPVYAELFGFEQPSDLDGLPLMDLIAPEERTRFKKQVLRQLDENDECQTAEVYCVGAASNHFRAALELCPAVVDGEPCTQIVIRDTAPQLALEEKIAELSSRDVQTGLYNRHFFMELLESTLSRRDRPPQVLIKVGMTNAADLRNACGVAEADRLVREAARVIENLTAEAVILSRFGEHDFLLLSDYANEPRRIAEALLDALDNHVYELPEHIAQPEYAIGIAISDRPPVKGAHEFVNRVLRAADYAARPGHERLAYAHQIVGATDLPALDLEVIGKIDHALAHEGFVLNFQPIVSLQGDSREHYAVLVRLSDDDQELLPEAFLTDAEQGERLAEIDRWVIRNSIDSIARRHETGQKTNFFINISSAGIKDDSLLLWICDCLREFKAKGAWLTFQFNDADLRDHLPEAQRLLVGLKKINCRTSVNRYRDNPQEDKLFEQLPIDGVKIAPELTTRLETESGYQRLEALNATLQGMGKTTVATAVENAASLAMLWKLRVNYLQGFFLHYPARNILDGRRR